MLRGWIPKDLDKQVPYFWEHAIPTHAHAYLCHATSGATLNVGSTPTYWHYSEVCVAVAPKAACSYSHWLHHLKNGPQLHMHNKCCHGPTTRFRRCNFQTSARHKAQRALPVALGTEVTLAQCREMARSRGLPFAGMQSQNSHQHQLGQCWGGHDGTQYGPGGACQNTPDGNKIGGAWTNALYGTL